MIDFNKNQLDLQGISEEALAASSQQLLLMENLTLGFLRVAEEAKKEVQVVIDECYQTLCVIRKAENQKGCCG